MATTNPRKRVPSLTQHMCQISVSETSGIPYFFSFHLFCPDRRRQIKLGRGPTVNSPGFSRVFFSWYIGLISSLITPALEELKHLIKFALCIDIEYWLEIVSVVFEMHSRWPVLIFILFRYVLVFFSQSSWSNCLWHTQKGFWHCNLSKSIFNTILCKCRYIF